MCLVAWFNTTFRRQRSILPERLGDLPYMITYSCPSCRTEVTKTPIENYVLKSVIDVIGVADSSPQMGNLATQDRPIERLLGHLI